MKRFSIFILVFSLCAGASLRAQDAATEERLNKLNGLIQDLQESKEQQRKQIEALSKELQNVRDVASKPSGNYASQDSLNDLSKTFREKLQEIDKKRIEDNERIIKEIEKLGKKMTASGPKPPKAPGGDSSGGGNSGGGPSGGNEKGYEHIVASGDTPSTIAQAYREQGVKVTSEQILKANPGLVAEKMKVGQKIFVPKPEK